MRSIFVSVAIVLSVLIAVPPVYASSAGPDPSTASGASRVESEHVAPQAVLDAVIQQQVSAVDRDRDTLRIFLQRGEVKAIAGKAGIDIARAQSAVATMDASDLAPLAAHARQAEQNLAGGASTVVISTTTIIIGLLVLILLIVALR
jgi:hypothetical protein